MDTFLYAHSKKGKAFRMNYYIESIAHKGCFQLEYQFMQEAVGFIILYSAYGTERDDEFNRIYSYNKTVGKWYTAEVPANNRDVSV